MKTHYSGGVVWEGGNRLRGWAVCCSGERAEDIRRKGNYSEWRVWVDCKACLKMLEKQDAFKESNLVLWEEYQAKGYCL